MDYKNRKCFKDILKIIPNKFYTNEDIEQIKPYGFVYLTINKVNGRMYIGKRVSINNYWKTYFGSGLILKQAIKKYGKDSFVRYIFDVANSAEDLAEKEKYWISKTMANKSENFYNIADGGDGRMDLYTISPIYCITNHKFYSNCAIASEDTGDSVEIVHSRANAISYQRAKRIIKEKEKFPMFRKKGSSFKYCRLDVANLFIFDNNQRFSQQCKTCIDLDTNTLYYAKKAMPFDRQLVMDLNSYRNYKYFDRKTDKNIVTVEIYLHENEMLDINNFNIPNKNKKFIPL